MYYINSPTIIPVVTHNEDADDFESWSYVSDKGDGNSLQEPNLPSPSNPQSELRYKTSLEVVGLRNKSDMTKNKVPEVAAVSVNNSSHESPSNPRAHEAAEQSKF